MKTLKEAFAEGCAHAATITSEFTISCDISGTGFDILDRAGGLIYEAYNSEARGDDGEGMVEFVDTITFHRR